MFFTLSISCLSQDTFRGQSTRCPNRLTGILSTFSGVGLDARSSPWLLVGTEAAAAAQTGGFLAGTFVIFLSSRSTIGVAWCCGELDRF